MASTFNRFGALAVKHSFRTRPQVFVKSLSRSSYFHHSSIRRDDDVSKPTGKATQNQQTNASPQPIASTIPDSAEVDEVVDYGELDADRDPFWGFPSSTSAGERKRILKEMEAFIENPPEDQKERVSQWRREVAILEQEAMRDFEARDEPEPLAVYPKVKEGLFNMGEKSPQDELLEDPEDEGNDMTSTAHGELEQHRELREYMRIAAWEMPLLSKYAQNFEAPSKEYPLRFRHTTYMGETHPAQNKIVLEFCTADLPLSPAQRLKLIKLVGVRYDPRKDLVKMSCEMFETPAQNKRYLGDLVDTLMMEAKSESTAEGGKDEFLDIQPDFRHIKFKNRLPFPSAWKMTSQRRAALDAERSQRAFAEQDRKMNLRLVSGPEIIEAALNNQATLAQTVVERQRAGVRPTRHTS